MTNNLEKLAVDHRYYCASTNFFSNEFPLEWESMTDFLDEFEGADIDMNLVFRWDVQTAYDYDTEEEIKGKYSANVFIMGQRKGKFIPNYIKSITEDETERFIKYLNRHLKALNEMWQPLTNPNNKDSDE